MTEHTTPLSPEDRAFRERIAVEIHEIFKIPGNALNFSIMIAQQTLSALKAQQQEAERRYARPVLVRVEYEGAVRATVLDANDDGLLSVLLEERVDGEWTKSTIDDVWYKTLSNIVLSQTAQPGDVWFITNNATVERELEKAAGFFDSKLRQQAVEKSEAE